MNIKPGDTLGLKISGIYVRWYHNGVEVLKKSAWTLRLWRVCIKYGHGETHITDLTINGQPVEDFDINGNVQIETPKSSTVAYSIHIGNECDPSVPNGIEPKQNFVIGEAEYDDQATSQTERNSQLSVHNEDGTTNIYDAVLNGGKSGQATIMVFDTSGKVIYEGQMEGDVVKTSRFRVPVSGVYIVKAITDNGEHTQKILAK